MEGYSYRYPLLRLPKVCWDFQAQSSIFNSLYLTFGSLRLDLGLKKPIQLSIFHVLTVCQATRVEVYSSSVVLATTDRGNLVGFAASERIFDRNTWTNRNHITACDFCSASLGTRQPYTAERVEHLTRSCP